MKVGNPQLFKLCRRRKWADIHTFDTAEIFLMSSAVATGTCGRQKFRFSPSDRLRLLRQTRKQVHDNATRKSLSFQIGRLHRKECRQWKVSLLRQYLQHPARLKELQGISSSTSKPLHQHPPLHELATMLEELFTGTSETPLQPNHLKKNHLTEEPWTLQELMRAIEKLKCGGIQAHFKQLCS